MDERRGTSRTPGRPGGEAVDGREALRAPATGLTSADVASRGATGKVIDVLTLKVADVAMPMGTGSPAARSVAQIVLLDNNFSFLPSAVAEGRRGIGNIERAANLFLTKTVYSVLLAIVVVLAHVPYPFLPRHRTMIGSLAIGIPAFFLALAPNTERAKPRFVRRVLRFAVPCGVMAAAARPRTPSPAPSTTGIWRPRPRPPRSPCSSSACGPWPPSPAPTPGGASCRCWPWPWPSPRCSSSRSSRSSPSCSSSARPPPGRP